MYLVGPMAEAIITFRALAPGDPELANAPSASSGAAQATPSAVDTFSADLLKLDDLHKKGILTDENSRRPRRSCWTA